MARVKKLNFLVRYGDTGYFINDLGIEKSPRFELYYQPDKKVVLKTNNPIDCNNWMDKNIWKGKTFINEETED